MVLWCHLDNMKCSTMCGVWLIFLALATPREIFLKKVPFSLPTPHIFNLDKILALTKITLFQKMVTSLILWWDFSFFIPKLLILFLLSHIPYFLLDGFYSFDFQWSWRGTLPSFYSHIEKEAQNLVLRWVRESLSRCLAIRFLRCSVLN